MPPWAWDEMPADSFTIDIRTFFMVTLRDIQQARSLLHSVAVRTPLVLCKLPDDRQIFLKPENLQPIGSFKLRGAPHACGANNSTDFWIGGPVSLIS